jgi:hypothetical protein
MPSTVVFGTCPEEVTTTAAELQGRCGYGSTVASCTMLGNAPMNPRFATLLPLAFVAGCVLVSPLGDGHQLKGSDSGGDAATTASGGGSVGGSSQSGGESPSGGGGTGTGTTNALVATFGERSDADFQGVTADTQLDWFYDNRNYGTSPTGWIDDFPRVILLRFDLEMLGSVTVAGATLHLFTDPDALASSNANTRVFEILEGWDEGTQDGKPGIANWYDRTPTDLWTEPGCGIGSRSDTELATFKGDMVDQEYDVDLPAALIQGWVDDPSTNHGVALVCYQADETGFVLSENATTDHRPMLTISYAPR